MHSSMEPNGEAARRIKIDDVVDSIWGWSKEVVFAFCSFFVVSFSSFFFAFFFSIVGFLVF